MGHKYIKYLTENQMGEKRIKKIILFNRQWDSKAFSNKHSQIIMFNGIKTIIFAVIQSRIQSE